VAVHGLRNGTGTYHPEGSMHRKWSVLAARYASRAESYPQWIDSHSAMRELCEFIESSFLKDQLFAHTSMNTLYVSQVAVAYPPPPRMTWLRVEPISAKKVEFRLEDTMRPHRQWRRAVNNSQVINRFKKFVRQAGWAYQSFD